ncbi:hypothetical protein ABPG72_002568 [Tetrahymena utriculariae]
MSDKQYMNIHVLVAEDDNFQRLALIDILTLCDYQVTAVENGRLARDELLKQDSNIDIVLLDLYMPEMDGFELLSLMQEHENLQKIPVIMMSSDKEEEKVATCISKGAKDYIFKPLRVQNVKAIAKYVQFKDQGDKNSNLVGIQQYKVLKTLGQGASGSVELVQKNDGKLYALKTISMKYMNETEKRSAQSEVTLLKVLDAPTIIRYYEAFVQNDSIYIVMEYAKEGALSDKIQEHKTKGIKIDEESILYFTSQIIIALFFMHQKKILHRDIKSQNLFLTKENVVKLGDFGISKALGTNADFTKTLVGTPYFMSPEVCAGQPYGDKADIWALGCTLYEMVMLRRPFDCENINTLFTMIRSQDPPPLHDNCSTDIRMLITLMLNKDPLKRPFIWDLVNIPIINKNIKKYHQQEAPDDPFLIELLKRPTSGHPVSITNTPSNSNNKNESSTNSVATNNPAINNNSQETQCNTLEQISKALSENLKPYDLKMGMFHVERNVINGKQIFDWFNQYYPNYQTSQLVELLQNLVEKKYIHHISGPQYEPNINSLFRFQFDMPGMPQNCYKIWNKQARAPRDIMQDIIQQANCIIQEICEQYTGVISEDKLIQSKKYTKFQEMVCELQKVYLQDLTQEDQRKSFFLNLIQIMQFHQFMKEKYDHKRNEQKKSVSTILDLIQSFFPFFKRQQKFEYRIGHQTFSIEDVKHGILRCNKRHKGSSFHPFAGSDDKYQLIQQQDLRVLILFKEENASPSSLLFIKPETFEEQLNQLCAKFMSRFVCFDRVENDLTLHKIFQIYQNDFGKDQSDTIKWVSKYTKGIGNVNDLISSIKQGEVFIQFKEQFEI